MSVARFHVMPQDGLWRVVKVGELFKGPYRTRHEAIQVAQLLALLAVPSRVLIHDLTGRVQAETLYGA